MLDLELMGRLKVGKPDRGVCACARMRGWRRQGGTECSACVWAKASEGLLE